MVRLGYCEPCEARRLPVSRTLASLRGSAAWRYYRPYLSALTPSDIWREGCWRFITYPAVVDARQVDVVFSVFLKPRRPPVRAAVVDATEGVVPISTGHRVASGPFLDAWRPADARPGGIVVLAAPRRSPAAPAQPSIDQVTLRRRRFVPRHGTARRRHYGRRRSSTI